jgi:hypothetical protein
MLNCFDNHHVPRQIQFRSCNRQYSNPDRMAARPKMTPAETERFTGLLREEHNESLSSLCKRDEIIIEKDA